MSAFIRLLLNLSVYANRRNITIFMTYLYALTLVVLIGSHVRLSKDFVLKDTSLKSFLKRSLTEYKETDDATREVYMQERGVVDNGDIFVARVARVIERHDPFREGMRPQGRNKHRGDKVVDKDAAAMVRNNEVQDLKHAPPDLVKSGKDGHTHKGIKSKYPDVEIVDNFKFDDIPEVKENDFQNIMTDGTFLVFSAILDNIYGKPYIKALAINGNTFLPKFYCELTYDEDEVITVRGKIWMLPDHHEKIYKTVFLYCALPNDNVPLYVSIIPIKEPVRLHRLPVMYHPKQLHNFTVCLSPIFFNYSIEYELVQWFEINKLMGADSFIVYNYSTVGRTDEILNHYEKEGWVKVIQWHFPPYTDLHYYGQIAMINDCLFRSYRVSKYMVNIDIDELIIPRRGKNTWTDLMTSLPQDSCEYSFRSTLMPTESKDVFEGKQRARELNLHFLLRMSRREYIFGKTVRSKYIVNTTCIDTVGIHYCWKYRNGTADTQRHHVTPRDALAYHFRNEPVAKKGREVEEKAVYKYHTQLINNAKARWEKINAERKLLNKISTKKHNL